MKAVILAEVFKEDQIMERDRIQAKICRIREYAVRRGFEVVKEFMLTPGDYQNPMEILQFLECHNEPLALCIDTIDELQDYFQMVVPLDHLKRRGRIEIHSCRDTLVIKRDSNISETMRWDMQVMVAQRVASILENFNFKAEIGGKSRCEQLF